MLVYAYAVTLWCVLLSMRTPKPLHRAPRRRRHPLIAGLDLNRAL